LIAISRTALDGSLLFLALAGLAAAVFTLQSVRAPHARAMPNRQAYGGLALTLSISFVVAALLGMDLTQFFVASGLLAALFAGFQLVLPRLSIPGALTLAIRAATLLLAALWGALFVQELDLPPWLEAGSYVALGLSLLLTSAGMVESFAREALLTHARWQRPVAPPRSRGATPFPKVSLHLPCYAEPPQVVMGTMNRLAALEYDRFEVLVCDNNTKDEALWRPLEEHCRALNERLGKPVFRFFHVAPLAGAKAGALNFLLEHTAPDAELIGVVDADYYSRPDFLARLAPCFEDQGLGYIQTPHDYRGYQGSSYLSACYWEYMPSNKIDWGGVSEYGGAFTIGTMCLLRAEALRRAGGWAEWCLTEDSEVSVRIRAAGYHGAYFVETFGRGLIPETFDDYKKQRFRWTAGPVQQLRRHWRLFLPAPFAPVLPGWTKLLEIARCITPLARLAALVMSLVGAAMMGGALASGSMEPLDLPNLVWGLLVIGLLTSGVQTVHRYLLSGCTRLSDMIRGEIARASLTYVVLVAGVAGLSSRPLAWRRTPKFALAGSDASALAATMPEVIAGIVCCVLTVVFALSGKFWGGELALLAALGLAGMALSFFCAPVMAAMAVDHANQAAKRAHAAALARPQSASTSSAKAA
jgi:hypothetical protein